MLINYLKIFLKVTSQNKLFTFLSLFGISLTIMFVMIFSMTISKITSGSGPEEDLEKIIFAWRVKTRNTTQAKGGGYSTSACSRILCEDLLKKVESADIASMYSGPSGWEFIFNGEYQLRQQTQTDAEFWELFNYKFIQGRPYTREEVQHRANFAVITRSLKELLFGNEENVLGKTIHYTSFDLVVTGVVEDPPPTAQNASGDLYFPYTVLAGSDRSDVYLGLFKMGFKAGSRRDFSRIRDEVREMISRLDAADTTISLFLPGPNTQLEKMMIGYGDPEAYSRGSVILRYIATALAFLLLPAVNLMALNFARIHERGEEIAVRKSFGASGVELRRQFLFENILMTLMGGLLGILLSYVVVAVFGRHVSLSNSFFWSVPISFSFNFTVFTAAFLACLIFGLLSGYLPAVRLARMKPAVYLKGGEL